MDDLTEGQRLKIAGLQQDALNRLLDGDLGAIDHSVAMKPNDPAFILLLDDKQSIPVTYRRGCYICEDPEFAAMGLPLCRRCPRCTGHIAADDDTCDTCGGSDNTYTQWDADGLAPDGFPDSPYGDVVPWPLGDFETCEPFRVQVGVLYDGSPRYFGDWIEPHVIAVGDYVEAEAEQGGWRGTVTDVLESGWVTVRVEEPRDSTSRNAGDLVSGWASLLRWLYTVHKFGGE